MFNDKSRIMNEVRKDHELEVLREKLKEFEMYKRRVEQADMRVLEAENKVRVIEEKLISCTAMAEAKFAGQAMAEADARVAEIKTMAQHTMEHIVKIVTEVVKTPTIINNPPAENHSNIIK